ncbi:VSP [Giardia lamblia P15]|uniref:VSP n=1 Tax=Giardia intestinalis (strain P15) TaxID=658858 RepID=E1EXE5_GIAIA|nr:VSP [Giardia lamblia P15]
MFNRVIVVSFILQFVWTASEAETCTEAGEGTTAKCLTGKCDVWINSKKYCSQCAKTDEYLINGECNANVGASGCQIKARAADGTCTQCGDGYFLYKNGCYAIGGTPGNEICADTLPSDPSGTAGKCQNCAPGYFNNPAADAAGTPPCIACNDTSGFTDASDGNKVYKGIKDCAVCSPPNVLAAAREDKVAVCESCIEGNYVENNGATCTACTDANCAKCRTAGQKQCIECKATGNEIYLKKEDGTEMGVCVTDVACKTQDTHFPTTDANQKKICTPCNDKAIGGVDGCQTCTLKDNPESSILITCSTCTVDTNKPNIDGTKCVPCDIQDCIKCNEENMCEECTGGKSIGSLRNECMEGCPAGTRDVDGMCTSCHTSCAECDGDSETSCTACYPGAVLDRMVTNGHTGACIPECTGKYAENCEANQCTAVVGGSKYCSRCKSGYVPVDGLCVLVETATRASPTGCTPSENNDGTCKACTATYFLQSGGCYQSAAYPGSKLCGNAQDGKCTNCANEQKPEDSTGSCPACASGCKTCDAASKETCKTCLPGYYLAGAKCVKCDTDDPNGGSHIVGVPNCISCAAPASPSPGASTPVTCYVKTDGTSGGGGSSGGGSTNKSGLSTGAIAGISVAVVVVVGGLVGFLCWWFLCRGKA